MRTDWSRGARGLVILMFVACGGQTPAAQNLPRVNVVSASPDGATWEDMAPIELTFDRPIVRANAVGRPVRGRIVSVAPDVAHAVHWRDRQTLVVRPSEAMKPGTRYTLSLLDTFPAVVPEQQRRHAFVHHPLQGNGVSDVDPAWFPPQGDFGLRFNLPVRARDVAARCTFATSGSRVPMRARNAQEKSTTVVMRPARALRQGQEYEIACNGLRADGGNAGIGAPIIASVHVYPAAGVAEIVPARGGRVSPDDLEIVLRTATPVPLEEIRRRVSIRPEIPGFRERWMSRDPTTFYQVVNMEAQEGYTITVARGLRDQFGQTLAARHASTFQTTRARPRVHMETGIYAVEAESEGYPIWSRMVRQVNVQCAFVPPARLAELLTGEMDYDPWYSAGGEGALNWSEQHLTPTTFEYQNPAVTDEWRLENVDFTQRCGENGRRGVYLVEVRSPDVERDREGDDWYRYPHRVLANVTNMGVLLKAGPSSGLVWVTQISDGAPVANANVTVYDPQGQRVHTGRTDDNGLARLPGSRRLLRQNAGPTQQADIEEGEEDEYEEGGGFRAQRMIVVVEKEGDVAALDGNWSNGIQLYNFGVPRDTATGGETAIRGFVLSDRGIYRPGEDVHFKGFVRELSTGASPAVPRDREIDVLVEDADGMELMSQTVALNEFGSFSFDHHIDAEATLGDYYVSATLHDHTFRQEFSVEEFRPAAFEITERAPAEAPVRSPGQPIQLGFEARYLFGAPVSNAPATWSVNRRRRFVRFSEYPEYAFDDWSSLDTDYFWSRYSEPTTSWIADGRSETGDDGAMAIEFTDRYTQNARGPQDYIVDVRVTDPTDQVIGKRSVITVHPTDVYLGLHTQEYVQAVGMPFAINAVALTPDGRRVEMPATLSFTRRRRTCEGSSEYGAWGCTRAETEVTTHSLQMRSGGTTTFRFNPTEAGEYVIRLTGTDRQGRDVSASSMVWVIGEGEAFWSGDESVRMSLIASRDRYEPGDTARLVPQAALGGATALITTERDGVIDARVVRLGPGVSAIEVPIVDAHAPNVFVSVAAVRGRRGGADGERPLFRMGVANLEVAPTNKRLNVEIRTERQDYRPGETVNGTLRVTSNGAPVRADVALSVADEGILSLINYQTPDPMRAFYRPWSLGVENATNWNRIARQRPPLDWEDGEDGGDGGEESGDERTRSRFVSSAFWNPSIITDAEGNSTFTFEAPDNLTAFRLMAIASDAADRFGSSERRIRINKELMVTPVLPRFFSEGDRAEIGVTVHNHTNAAGEVRVQATGEGITLATRERTVRVRANGVERVLFTARVPGGQREEARVRFEGTMGEHQDAFALELPIRRPHVIDHHAIAQGRLDQAGNVDAAVAWDDTALPRASELDLTIDRTGLGELGPSLRYLVQHPYWGLESSLSSVLPIFAARDLATTLHIRPIETEHRMDVFVRLALARIVRHQQADGMFGYWPAGDSSPHLSAYALYVLHHARAGGAEIPEHVITNGLRGLRTWANAAPRRIEPQNGEGATIAQAAHVLALYGQPDAGLNARLYEARAALPAYGKALLLRALVSANAPAEQRRTLAGELEALARRDDDRAMIRETGSLSWYWSSDVRSTALALSALIEHDSDHALLPALARGLAHARERGGYYRTTQDNAYSLVALAQYARTRAGGSTQVTIRIGDQELASQRISGGEVFHLSRALSEVTPGTLHIEASGPITYAARLSIARTPSARDATAHGFTISREYLDFETHTPVTQAHVGQLITVRLRVRSDQTREHVALVDPLPGGFEIVNTNLATEQLAPSSSRSTAERFFWTNSDLRDDGATAFASRFYEGGERVFEYVARATIEGSFAAPSAQIEAMYAPENLARTAATRIEVVREEE